MRAIAQLPVADPDNLDLLALRKPVTRLLAWRFGLAIRVNQSCQSPCGKVGVSSGSAQR